MELEYINRLVYLHELLAYSRYIIQKITDDICCKFENRINVNSAVVLLFIL